MTTNYSIVDSNGDHISQGLDERIARTVAQREANERGETVLLCADGVDDEIFEPARAPVDAFGLREVARVDVDGDEYVVYSDGAYTAAMEASEFDEPTTESDYSQWCSSTSTAAVASAKMARQVLTACAEQSSLAPTVIHLSGTCRAVSL